MRHKRYRWVRWDRHHHSYARVRFRWVRVLGWEVRWRHNEPHFHQVTISDWWYAGPYCKVVRQWEWGR